MKRGNVFFSLESEISRIDVALEWKRVFHQIELLRLPTCDSFFLHLIFQMGGRLWIRYPDKCDRFRSRLARARRSNPRTRCAGTRERILFLER